MTSLSCLLAVAAVVSHALAEDGARRRLLEQKTLLMQRLLADSPAVQRIRASGDAEAVRYLQKAESRYRASLELAGEGRLEASEAAINEAMALIGRARQLVPDPHARTDEQRARLTQLMESVQALLASARRHATARPAAGAEVREDLGRAGELLERARTLAGAGGLEEAHHALSAAEQSLLAALARMLGSATLDFTPRFDSPAEEFAHESERFTAYRSLVPVALAQLAPPPEKARLVEEQVAEAAHLRDAAGRHAAHKEFDAALRAIREAIGRLQRALAAAGLAIGVP
jgi:hypothetical protein